MGVCPTTELAIAPARAILISDQHYCSHACYHLFSSLLQESCKLSRLSLAGNTRIGNVGAGSLLIAANSSKTLQKLNLLACGVTSPLDAAFFEALKTLAFQNNGTLTELDLSHNLISVVDKERLAEEWELNSTGESLSHLKDNLCIFTKL